MPLSTLYTGHITTGSFVGNGNQCIVLASVLYSKLTTIGKELPTFPHKVQGLNYRPQRWETSELLLGRHGPLLTASPTSKLCCTLSVAYYKNRT